MRIGCLQFAPLVGDLDNNLNRADAVLNRVDPEDLDLLVLPELAFTGYNFQSLRDISPFLEYKGSGLTSLWARTVALRYECTVVVGYPEKVDPTLKWPTDPEYYNSAIIVNSDGETIGNYRKTHLFRTDETWALENPNGFYGGFLAGLGRTAIGICMDLNPYQFKAPWDAFEFAFHVLEMQANLVVVSMAWMTAQDGRQFSRMPQEPDMETLSYWVSRLEPIIRSEDGDEVIIVFANRCGIEDDAIYAGTSAVVGVQDGEVRLYGILGRGVKDLLVVDTSLPPHARLMYHINGEPLSVDESGSLSKEPSDHKSEKPPEEPDVSDTSHDKEPNEATDNRSVRSGSDHSSMDSNKSNASRRSSSRSSPKSVSKSQSSKSSRRKPNRKELSVQTNNATLSHLAESPTILTPTCPSPTPIALRPRLVAQPAESITMRYLSEHSPTMNSLAPKPSSDSQALTLHPSASTYSDQIHILGGGITFGQEGTTAGTSSSQTSLSHFSDASPSSPKLFWIPSSRMLETPLEKRGWTPGAASDMTTFSDQSLVLSRSNTHSALSNRQSAVSQQKSHQLQANQSRNSKSRSNGVAGAGKSDHEGRADVNRPPSTKSRNASRSRGPERLDSSLDANANLDLIAHKLEEISQRVDSAQGSRQPSKRRESASRADGRAIDDNDMAENSIPIAACASLWRNSPQPGNRRTANGTPSGQRPLENGTRPEPHRSTSNTGRGRDVERPSSRAGFGRRQQSGNQLTRQVSRGRQPDVKSPPAQSSRSSRRSANQSRADAEAEPVDLSEYRLIEEYTSPSCPIHGSRSHSRAHRHGVNGHHHVDPNGTSHGSPHPRRAHIPASDGHNAEPSSEQRPRPGDDGPPPRPDQKNLEAVSSPKPLGSNTPSSSLPFEPKTPKAMTLVFDPKSTLLSESVLKRVEPDGLGVSRPRSAVW